MSRGIERQNQQWPHRLAALQQRPPVQEELSFDEKREPLWKPPHGLAHDFDPFGDLGERSRQASVDWSRAKPGPMVDIPPREQDPDDYFATRPYSGPLCSICNRPPQWVSGPSHRHAHIRRVRLAAMPTTLQLSGDQPDYTGSHGMQVHEDEQGQWSLKQPKPSLAFTVPLEAAAANLQRSMGLEAPESHVINHQGRPAVVSKWYPNSTQAFQKPPRLTDLSPDDHMTIQKNHVLDWLIGNHDSHVGNWMRTEDGKLVSIDKGQAVKYFGQDRLDPHFHPNYYAREPIYNQLWRDHAQGRGQMHDPRTGELGDFVKQVQSIPDDQLKGMFRDYAHSAAKSGLLLNPDQDPSRELGSKSLPPNDPEVFLSALVERKNNLHHDLGEYYDRMSSGRQLVGAYKTPEGLFSITDVAKTLGVPPPQVHTWLKPNRRNPAPEPTHIVNNTRYWDDLDPWHEWSSTRNTRPGRPSTELSEPDLTKLWNHKRTDPREVYDPVNRYYDDMTPEKDLLRSLHRQPGPGEGGDQLSRYAAADPGQAQGERLYLPGDVADHLGVPRPTLMSWIYNGETPTPTHTSKPHEEMWDNLDVWNKWYNRRQSLEAGPRGYPDGWAKEFQSNRKPHRMLTIPDISDQTGMSLSDVYKSVYRPGSGASKLPNNTHYAIGDDKRGVHFWDNLRPTEKQERNRRQGGLSDQPDDVTHDYSLAEFLQWCVHNRQEPDRDNLAQYAAVSGMNTENYLDIYLFLQT